MMEQQPTLEMMEADSDQLLENQISRSDLPTIDNELDGPNTSVPQRQNPGPRSRTL